MNTKNRIISVIALMGIILGATYSCAQGTWKKLWGPAQSVVLGHEQIDGGTRIFAVDATTGDIFQYGGIPLSWERVGGPGKSFVVAGGGLYGISPDGSAIYGFKGTAGQWRQVGGAAQEIYGTEQYSAKALFATNPQSGDIYNYDSNAEKWTRVGGPGRMFATGYQSLYGLSPDGNGVYKYTGVPGKWRQIGGPAAKIYAGGNALFATNPQSGDIYSFDDQSSKWTKIGGPGRTFAVNHYGDLYGLSPDAQAVYKYMGTPGKWEKIGGPAGNIYAGGSALCATNPNNQDLWCQK
jgi:hypothetical protein